MRICVVVRKAVHMPAHMHADMRDWTSRLDAQRDKQIRDCKE